MLHLRLPEATGSLLQLALDLGGIVSAAVLTLLVQRVAWRQVRSG